MDQGEIRTEGLDQGEIWTEGLDQGEMRMEGMDQGEMRREGLDQAEIRTEMLDQGEIWTGGLDEGEIITDQGWIRKRWEQIRVRKGLKVDQDDEYITSENWQPALQVKHSAELLPFFELQPPVELFSSLSRGCLYRCWLWEAGKEGSDPRK